MRPKIVLIAGEFSEATEEVLGPDFLNTQS